LLRLRIPLLVLLLLATVLVAVPAAATPAPVTSGSTGPTSAAEAASPLLAQLRAAGWRNVRYTQTSSDHRDTETGPRLSATDPTSWHQDGVYSSESPGWPNPANGRVYTILANAYIDHSADEGNQWRIRLDTQCRRRLGGGAPVANPCNWYLGIFQALGWDNFSDAPQHIYGSKNLPNTTCAIGSGGVGSWRVVDSLYPWKMSYIGAIIVDFRDANCTQNFHTSQSRSYGSRNARLSDDVYAIEPDWTGWN
jgi:hypothetical protein